MTELTSGWTTSLAQIYRFSHIKMELAHRMIEDSEDFHIVETINSTIAKSEPDKVHRNLYFCIGIHGAIGFAAQIAIQSADVAECVVAIRRATVDEVDGFREADSKLNQNRMAIPTEPGE